MSDSHPAIPHYHLYNPFTRMWFCKDGSWSADWQGAKHWLTYEAAEQAKAYLPDGKNVYITGSGKEP